MSHRKYDEPAPTSGEIRARKLKLIEGSVIFVAALSLCIYLGIRFAHDPEPGAESVAVAMVQPDQPPNVAVPRASVSDEPVAAIAPAGTEPAGVVESKISATRGEAPPLEEILPDVPLMVTYATAEEVFLAGRYDQAAGMFATYCGDHPDNAWGQYMRGLALWKAGEHSDARDAFNAALNLSPDHFKSLVNLARVELDLAEPDAALRSIQRALDIAPENIDARRVLGRAYHNLDRQEEAATAYLEVLRQDADDAWTLNNLALIWIEQEEFGRAVAPLARAAELLPDVPVIRNNLGTALERTGHLIQAREQFDLARGLGSGRGEASYVRLDEMVIPVETAPVDLPALAAGWTAPPAGGEITTATASAVAAASFDETESGIER